MRILISVRFRRLVANHSLLGYRVDPELARFELPFIRIVSTRVNILTSSLDSEDGIELYSALSLEEM